jgi:SAM-dependent methyltransferase
MLRGRGDFNRLYSSGGVLEVSGWIVDPRVPATAIRLFVDGAPASDQAPAVREDVYRAFPWIGHARDSAFCFRWECPRTRCAIAVAAFSGEHELVRIEALFAPEFEGLPVPGDALLTHILPGPDPFLYQASGLYSYASFERALPGGRRLADLPRVLDWGCGSGRLSRLLLADRPGPEVFGCDIDGDAVRWCRENLPGGHFEQTELLPPLPYGDGFFPLVLAYSVFTHLKPEVQFAWLGEMRRVLAPGGLLLASIHGPLAASGSFPDPPRGLLSALFGRDRAPSVLKDGFFDAGEDAALAGIAPEGYYRGVFQTPEWTRREWSRFFQILEIREGGMNGHQDLVVLERR